MVKKQAYSISKRLVLLASCFESARMLTGVVHAFFLITRGVSLKNLATLQIINTTTVLLLAIPLGMFADLVSRKLTTVLSLMLIGTFYYLCLFAPNMPYLIAANILYTIGLSAIKHASEAWIIDAVVDEYGKTSHMTAYFSHLKKEITGFGNMLTGVVGCSIAYLWGYNYLYAFSSLTMILIMLLFGLTKTTGSSRINHPSMNIKNVLHLSIKELFFSKYGLFYLLISLLIAAAYQPILHFWQPLFVGIFKSSAHAPIIFRDPLPALGLTFFCANSAIFLFNYLVRVRLKKYLNLFYIAIAAAFLAGIFFIIFGIKNPSSPWPYLLAFSGIHGLLTILINISLSQYATKAPQRYLSSIFALSHTVQGLFCIGVLKLIKHFVEENTVGLIFTYFSIPMIMMGLSFFIGKLIYKENKG